MDINLELKNTENALRDFIASILEKRYGTDWITTLGVTPDRIATWKERMVTDKLSDDERIIYYSDFYDLRTIIHKQWDPIFKEIFIDKKATEVYLALLEKFRNTESHRREILPYQTDLVSGICGEIRTRIIKYRSKQETGKDCFARFEFAQDNLGSSWKIGDHEIETGLILKPGDVLEFVVTASDPEGKKLYYQILFRTGWQENNKFNLKITEEDIAERMTFMILVKSERNYYANPIYKYDHAISFVYSVLPKK